MKRYFALALALVMLLSLAACGDREYVDDPKALETADTYYDVDGNSGSVALTGDSAKVLLGVYTPEQLGLKDTIDQYDLSLSATEYEGKTGCKIEAFAEGADTAEGVFMIVGTECFVYNAKTEKFVSLSSDNTKAPAESETENDSTIPDDPEITFRYHKENNYLMQQRFSKYDIEKLGLSKEVSEYVFIVNGNSGYAVDGEKVYYVDVYEKNGEKTGARLGFSEDGEYKYSPDISIYEKIEK